jgi:hypothetical protein
MVPQCGQLTVFRDPNRISTIKSRHSFSVQFSSVGTESETASRDMCHVAVPERRRTGRFIFGSSLTQPPTKI